MRFDQIILGINTNIVKIVLLFGAVLIISIVLPSCEKTYDNMTQMSVTFSWDTTEDAGSISPEIKLSSVPDGTDRFLVILKDLDCDICNHGSGYVNFKGNFSIEKGAVNGSYVGPRPPPGKVHTYEFTIKALDKSGNVIGIGKQIGKYPFGDR